MAQTRTITRRKLLALRLLDIISRALHLVSPRSQGTHTPRSFLVVEPWGLGDVVLSTPLLAALRNSFPDSRISLLAKEYASDLLANTGLVDEVIAFDFPWTAFTGKFRPSRYSLPKFFRFLRLLRSRDFDVSLDARRDIRSNVIVYLAGARRRIGYDFGGGAHLLTDVIPSGSQNDHKISDWLALLGPLGIEAPTERGPELRITTGERRAARARLASLGFSRDRPVVGLHPGASQGVRRWSNQKVEGVIELLSKDPDLQLLLFTEKPGDWAEPLQRLNVPSVSAELREFMALISECDLLVCSDSGPMHLAGALGVPVTALFGPQRSEWYGPRGPIDRIVQVEKMPCRPCFDACIYARPLCMDGIKPENVAEAVGWQIQRNASRRSALQTSSL